MRLASIVRRSAVLPFIIIFVKARVFEILENPDIRFSGTGAVRRRCCRISQSARFQNIEGPGYKYWSAPVTALLRGECVVCLFREEGDFVPTCK